MNPVLLPAVERYDGPTFRLLRRYLKQIPDKLDVYVLSALFGLIHCEEAIPDYNQKMTARRSIELRPQVRKKLRQIFKEATSEQTNIEVLFCMGKNYFEAVKEFIPSCMAIEVAPGPIGIQLSKLHQWLYHSHRQLPRSSSKRASPDTIKLRGIEIAMTGAEVLYRVREALSNHDCEVANYQSWYVLVDGVRLSPKWVISLLTGLPVSQFHSDEARLVLQRLGIKVHHT